MVLYDADQTKVAASAPEDQLVEAQREMILDLHDETLIAEPRKNGISDDKIEATHGESYAVSGGGSPQLIGGKLGL